ncbi:MAG: hypothetical protein M0R22_00005 [Dehalococcoidia bacterium]|nr:hypothetical protein [Dehalococcoidia bacterium]
MAISIKRLESMLELRNANEENCAKIMHEAMVFANTKKIGPALEIYAEKIGADLLPVYRDKEGDRIRTALEIMDKAWGSCGVEYIRAKNDVYCERGIDYLNTGDTYSATVMYDWARGCWRCCSYGDFIETSHRSFE